MLNLAGYEIKEQVYKSANSIVFKGIRSSDKESVIIKQLNKEYPTNEELKNFSREYEIIRNLNIKGTIKVYGLEKYENSLVIILEDFGGESLTRLMEIKSFDLSEIIEIIIQVIEILGDIHQHNIIHKDINPSNIIWNKEKKKAKIIDFGISTMLPRENKESCNPNILEGTLAYISPEQTGRMNRALDYRTDFYSLGVTFYEMLLQKRPFESDDDMEMIHSHIAKTPIFPHKINHNIPRVISLIVAKLMEKNAEDRYQSAFGLKRDLETCLEQIQTTGTVKDFKIGTKDFLKKFQISQKLYGREIEIQMLLDAFDRVSVGSREMMLVAGGSGIGKSAVVNEINKPITQKRGYFVSGKFDKLQRNIPYACLIHAFQELVRNILTESQDNIIKWKEKLILALSPNAQLMIEVVPELEAIIGKQPPASELQPAEAQNRFNRIMQCFIGVFANKEHPLVIFLDDLQWADSSSNQFLENFMTGIGVNYVLIIGSYRDNEVMASHPLAITLENIEKSGVPIHTIFLKPLELHHISQLIKDSIPCLAGDANLLADLFLKKTMGNPFFVNHLLQNLYDENLIEPDENQGLWKWDIEKVKKVDITDNVIDLMTGKIKKLSSKAQDALMMASCFGSEFDLKTLSVVLEKSLKEAAIALWDVLKEGLIISEDNLWVEDASCKLNESSAFNEKTIFRFLHDKVKEAAYGMIEESQKQNVHLKIGCLMLKTSEIKGTDRKTGEKSGEEIVETIDENLFYLANHLNIGSDLIDDISFRIKLAKINLKAGKTAKSSAAFESAYNYLEYGIRLLPENIWNTNYDLALELYVEIAEAAYLITEFEKMEELAEVVLKNARELLDKVRIYEVKISAKKAQNKPVEAVKIAIQILRILGMNLPENPGKIRVAFGLLKIKALLAGKNINEISELPDVKDPYKLAELRIMLSIYTSCYYISPELTLVGAFKILELSVRYGNSPYAMQAYIAYGIVLCGVLFDIESGYLFGELALKVMKRFNAYNYKPAVLFCINNFLRHWKEHLKETLPAFLEAYQAGLDTGNLEYAALSAQNYCYHLYFTGKELPFVEQELLKYGDLLLKLKQKTPYPWNRIYLQVVLNLMGKSESPTLLSGDGYEEKEMVPVHLESKDKVALFEVYFQKLILCYLFEEFGSAIENAKNARVYLETMISVLTFALLHFYESLAYLSVYPGVNNSEKRKILRRVKANQKKMQKWANHAPMNHLHKFYLVEAEKARVLNKVVDAIDYYDKAIELAFKNGYIQEEAMAKELAGRFYMSRNKEKIARVYLNDAYYLYKNWGAEAKVKVLEAKYPQFFSAAIEIKSPGTIKAKHTTTITTASTSSIALKNLDMNSVIKASQAILGEMVLEKLLKKMMHIVIENAGAQRGLLILEFEGAFFIQAEGNVDKEDVEVLLGIKLDDSKDLSQAISHFVIRTMQPVILNNVCEKGKFTQDPYVVEKKPLSLLCMPLINQGKLSGILYLENNLITDAFTPARLELLRVLSSQIAISIDNARLYGQLDGKNKELEKINLQIIHLLEATKELATAKNKVMAAEIAIKHLVAIEQNIEIKQADLYLPQKSTDAFTGYRLWENCQIVKYSKPYDLKEEKNLWLKGTNLIHVKDGILNIPVQSEKKKLAFIEIDKYAISSNIFESSKNIIEGVIRSLALILENLESEENDRLAGIGAMAASIVHDLKNPIGVIMGYADMAGDEDLSIETRKEYLEIISKESTRMSNMAHEVLEFSRGELNLALEVIDSKEYLDDVAKTLNPIFMNNDIAFVYEDEYNGVLNIDPDRIRRVILNLATNSRDAMVGAKTKNARFIFKIKRKKEGALMFAEDNGPGIPEHIHATLFEPFVTFGKSHGTGLGMAIVKKIIDAHGGHISFESESSKGTLFRVFFPLSESILNQGHKLSVQKQFELENSGNVLFGKNILIVDDNPIHSQMYVDYLKSTGCNCKFAANTNKAYDQLIKAADEGSPFNIAVIDKSLPGEDGGILGKKIKEDSRFKDTILVMITGVGARGDSNWVKEIGFDAYLTKPLKSNQFLECLTTLIQKDLKKPNLITKHSLSDAVKSKVRILMAEDNLVNQKLIMRMLNKSGYNAEVVANGREAVKAIQAVKYDVVLMDVQMPEMDGFEATKAIRSQEGNALNKDVPIIAMTGHSMQEDIDRCYEAGMSDYIGKPIKPDQMIKAIEKATSKEEVKIS